MLVSDYPFLKTHIEPRWKRIAQQRHAISADYLPWVADDGSLTKKLIAKAGGDFSVSVIAQSVRRIPLSEQNLLRISHRQWALLREVVLYGKQTPWVYARTAIPLTTLKGSLKRLHHLGNRPLGEQLFADPNMRRGELEAAKIFPHHLPNDIAAENMSGVESTWGRRSVFYLSSQPLLVSEIFLPALLNTYK